MWLWNQCLLGFVIFNKLQFTSNMTTLNYFSNIWKHTVLLLKSAGVAAKSGEQFATLQQDIGWRMKITTLSKCDCQSYHRTWLTAREAHLHCSSDVYVIWDDLSKASEKTWLCYKWLPGKQPKLFIKSHKLHTQILETLAIICAKNCWHCAKFVKVI